MAVLSKTSTVACGSAGALGAIILFRRLFSAANASKSRIPFTSIATDGLNLNRPKKKGQVDKHFLRALWILVRISVPSWFSKEVFLLLIQLSLLILRTFLSIRISVVNGNIVESIVRGEFHQFLKRIAVLASIAIPASVINSGIRYLGSQLAISYRERLVRYFHERYFESMRYYQVSNLDSRISNPDQALTETIDKWGKSLSDLFSNVTKPIFDIVLFSTKLTNVLGWQGPFSIIAYYLVSGVMIRSVSPKIGRLTAEAQRLEGKFRSYHNRLITYSEEVGFYNGEKREKDIINNCFDEVVLHMHTMHLKQFFMGVADTFLVKYGAMVVGYCVLGLPVFGSSAPEYRQSLGANSSAITRDYISNSSLLINLAQAIGRIVVSYKELQRLAGYTALVSDLYMVLDDLAKNKYSRKMVAPDKLLAKHLAPYGGKVVHSDNIVFDAVPVVTPNGDLLASDMSFQIEQGMNLMIVGPNGCGKSSLFRILGGLWPLFGGTLGKPEQQSIFYVPQKPYLPMGTLRDQVIYPHSKEDMVRLHRSDDDLLELLNIARLGYIVSREGGWDNVNDWSDVLSGGEKQRLAMARLFYHAPRFAILDECTSAVSVDVEGVLYSRCKELSISLITVSHRPSLWKYHDYKLEFDGRGGWSFGPMIIPKTFNHVP